MIAGTIGATVIALFTVPLGRALIGEDGANAYPAAAAGFAALATLIVFAALARYRDDPRYCLTTRQPTLGSLLSAAGNRAFVALVMMAMMAMMAMIVGVNSLDKSVLYYFKYQLADQRAGQLTLGWMMAVGGLALPLWLSLSRRLGARAVWFSAVALCIGLLALFVLADPRDIGCSRAFLVALQCAIVGLHFAIWAMLPDAIDFGASRTGIRAEATLFGLAASLQRVAIGLGTLIVGQGLAATGLREGAGLRVTIAVLPMAFFALAGLLMLASPLRRTGRVDEAGR